VRNFVFVICVFVCFACKKAENRSCIKTAGIETERIVQLNSFSGELHLFQKIKFELVPDTAFFAVVKGGKNLVELIEFDEVGSDLIVRNSNKCDFLRDYSNEVSVEIHFVSLNRVAFLGSKTLANRDTIKAEYFNLYIDKGAGSVDLTLDTYYGNVYSTDGASDYTLHGNVVYGHYQVFSNTFADVTDMNVAEKLEITSESSGDIRCRAEGIPLVVNILGVGNVIYYGTPSSITLNREGKGQLIKGD
jgi:hypothetical protein